MTELRKFLRKFGEEYSKIESLLPFFALPYLKEPHKHPLFSDIFSQEWTTNLK